MSDDVLLRLWEACEHTRPHEVRTLLEEGIVPRQALDAALEGMLADFYKYDYFCKFGRTGSDVKRNMLECMTTLVEHGARPEISYTTAVDALRRMVGGGEVTSSTTNA